MQSDNVRARCRFCGTPLYQTVVDLGMSPLCESYLRQDQLNGMEAFYPLHVYVCDNCFLVQLEEYVSPEKIFTEYAYFSSYSDSWLEHARAYTRMATERFGIDNTSLVVELASNDGYLLQYFVKEGVRVLGVEPALNVAEEALRKGIPTLPRFFGVGLANEMASMGQQADLLIGNNVLAQVPDLNDFVKGMQIVLKPKGAITMEFPHLLELIKEHQFDTIYHEHFSYFSFTTVEKIFAGHNLKLFDVERIPTHGGSLRIYACHAEDGSKQVSRRCDALRSYEEKAGVTNPDYYISFSEKVKETKRKLLEFLISTKKQRKSIAGYGAPGKGNTLLNYCGVRSDFVDYTVDRSPYKQGKFLPGTHIPIFGPAKIDETKPDYLLILPWNFKDEIIKQMAHIRNWGGKFVVPIPEVRVYP
jgi:hypothetical protein